jgi:hypothetical protein
VLQEVRRKRQHAAFHFHRGHVFRLKFLGGKIVRPPWIYFGAARKDIDGSKIIFGPCVNRQMRFGNDDDAGNSVRIKGMENNIHDSGFGHFRRFNHDRFDFVHIVQDFGVAMVEFDEEVPTERSQGEKNYRTSTSGVNVFRLIFKYFFRRMVQSSAFKTAWICHNRRITARPDVLHDPRPPVR